MTANSTKIDPGSAQLLRRRRLVFHPLTVAAINRLTADAVEIVLTVPEELAADYDYLPGQHIAVRARHQGREIRRSYSLCAPVGDGVLRIAVKVEPGGIYSTYANSQLTVGDVIEVMTPQGSFTATLDPTSAAHIGAVAAGSGITPVMALATAILHGAPRASFTLVYSSRTAEQVMFLDELADLKDRFTSRLAVHHVLTREQRLSPLHSGRLDPQRLDLLFERVVRPSTIDEWFLCGPVDLVQLVRSELATRGTDLARVHVELFTTGERTSAPQPAEQATQPPDQDSSTGHRITLTLTGRTSTVTGGEGERVLDAALRSRSDVPFSCAGGVCGTCRAKLVSGTVEMVSNFALEPDELAAGYVLTCQAVPTSQAVEVDYDV